VIERVVGEDHAGQRVDKFLRRLLPEVPQSHLYKLLRLRRVRVNGVRAHEDTLLNPGDRVVIRGDADKLLSAPAPVASYGQKLAVLYEDEHLLAVDKPAGLAAHPGSGLEGPTLVELARAHVGPIAAGAFEASPAHRLDRDTSGIVLVAKTRKAMVKLTELFTAGAVDKLYLALAKGRLAEERGVIEIPLPEHEQTARSRAERGIKLQEAVTHWRCLSEAAAVSLLACRIETGRTHQIRRHLAAIGHPVAGDRRHGDFALNRVLRREVGLRRMFLHAGELALDHPILGTRLELKSALPVELGIVLSQLGIPSPEVA
jgi:23S rRNA pseudouridine955/2504/2580 synthase